MFFRLLGHCFSVCVLMVSAAQAAVVLQIDLSTVNQVTISATTGLSLASVSGSDFMGVYVTVHGPVQRITPRRRDLRSAGAVTALFLPRT